MTAHEVELGVVEPDPVDPRVDEVADRLQVALDAGDELVDVAREVVELLDERAAEAAVELEAEQDDGGFDVDVWLLRAGTAAYGLGLLAWVVAFGLAVGAVWTDGGTSDSLAGSAVLTFAFGILSGVVGAKAVASIPDGEA